MRGGPGPPDPQGRHTCKRHRRPCSEVLSQAVLPQIPVLTVGASKSTRLLSQLPGAHPERSSTPAR